MNPSTEPNHPSFFKNLILELVELWQQVRQSVFFKRVAETFATRIILIAIGLVSSVIVARALGVAGRGLYAVATTVGTIGVQLGNLGLHSANTYMVAKNKTLLPKLLGNSLLISFVFGGLGAMAAALVFTQIPQTAPVHGSLLTLALISIPLGLAFLLLENLLLGLQLVRSFNTLELVNRGVGLAALVFLLVARLISVELFFGASVVVSFIGICIAVYMLRGYLREIPIPSFLLMKDSVSYGVKAYLVSLFSFIIIRIDLLMVSYMLGEIPTGYYSTAVAMADMVYLLPVTIGTILFPTLSAYSKGQEKWQRLKRLILPSTLVFFALCLGAVIVAPLIVRVLYGEDFLPAIPAFNLLMPGIFFLSVETVFMQYLNSIGLPKKVPFIWGLIALLNIGLNYWLIPVFGINGAAINSTICYGLLCAIIIWVVIVEKRKADSSKTDVMPAGNIQ